MSGDTGKISADAWIKALVDSVESNGRFSDEIRTYRKEYSEAYRKEHNMHW